MKSNQLIEGNSHLITLQEAIDMTARYRKSKDSILTPSTPKTVLALSETFNRVDFDTLFAQPDCVGIRVYFGMHENMDISAVFVGVNSNNEDIINAAGDGLTGDGNVIIENGVRCPDQCPPPSPLNP